MAGFTDYLEQMVMEHVFVGVVYTPVSTLYLALYTTTPTDTAAGTEVTGGSYARQVVTFGGWVAGNMANASSATFVNMPACTVTSAAVRDTLTTGGHILIYGNLLTPRTVAAGENLTIGIGDVVLTSE